MVNKLDDVLERAVATLQDNNPRARRAIYNRARESLVEQLNKVEPPLSVREICNRRLVLEQGIQRIERLELDRIQRPLGILNH